MSNSCSPPTSLPKHPARHTLRHRARTHFPSLSVATSSVSHPSPSDRRFSCLLTTALGSPFLTTSDPPDLPPALDFVDGDPSAVPRSLTVTRPSSPALSHTFSIISSSEIPEVFPAYNYPYPYVPAGLSFLTRSSPPPNGVAPVPFPSPGFGSTFNNAPFDRVIPPNPLKSLFPRLWEALSLPRPQRFPSPGGKGKEKATGFDWDQSSLNFQDLPPLDGEEGELIDDEACFIDVRVVTGIDILSLLPPELALYIFSTFVDLPSVLACLAVSRKWRALASDNCVWRGLFVAEASNEGKGWGINVQRVQDIITKRKTIVWGNKLGHAIDQWSRKRVSVRGVGVGMAHHVSPNMRHSSTASMSRTLKVGSFISQSRSSLRQGPVTLLPLVQAPLRLDWRVLYKERHELDKRWLEGEPQVKRLEGHTDSVYCLEFDSTRIITGSRDKTIKVWSLATGRLLGTLKGHSGSVLCLKFDKDWEKGTEEDDRSEGSWSQEASTQHLESRLTRARTRVRPGFMVSGSSDCSVCVWDLYAECPSHDRDGQDVVESVGAGEGQVRANVRRVLKGHSGGVLDLRIDKRWIVSCSKDTFIRVWDRRTLKLHRTLWGHEGPVNAVGLQSESGVHNARGGRVVSASGDGTMMMWDIESGERLKTFEGHDRGLACIEFKEDLIVSGSNDCKIKVWSASTGECIRTLVGHDLLVRALSFEPKSGRLVSASYDRTVKVWDLKSGKMVREFRNGHTSHIFDVKFDVGRIVSTSHDKKVLVLDFTQGIDSTVFV